MECPKCGGGAFLSEEELVKILEGTEPLRMIAKAKYQCRACSESFSRLICDTLEGRHKPPERPAFAYQQEQYNQQQSHSQYSPYSQNQYQQPAQPIMWKKQEEEDAAAEGIKFLDSI
ncbi:MAG: hypothetical protein KKB03_01080 [Nanoarchaeota archaeon]|nr:hypothetical protein [Nanoarchaeota archaeon]MBU2519820.1 hypothetical protein [Nanoarchaeota archaeon]